MANFCRSCGTALRAGVKFCPSCGTPIAASPDFCRNCGTELRAGVKFCPSCGTPVAQTTPQPQADVQPQPPEQPRQAARPQSETGGNMRAAAEQAAREYIVPAAEQAVREHIAPAAEQTISGAAQAVQAPLSGLAGELTFPQPGEAALGAFGSISGAAAQAAEILSPIKTVLSSVKGFFTGFSGLFKNKQWVKLIAAGVLALVWVALMVLSHYGTHIGVLDWLTFAQGGMGRSVPGWLGGLLGKTTVASALCSLIGGGFKSLGGGFKSLVSGSNFKPRNLGWTLLGAGAALALYQFFAGAANWRDTMSALSGALIPVMSLGRGSGFLSRLAGSLTSRVAGGVRLPQSEKSNGLLSGLTFGFTLGAAVSLIPFGWTPVILGGNCIIAGVVLALVFKERKEAAAA